MKWLLTVPGFFSTFAIGAQPLAGITLRNSGRQALGYGTARQARLRPVDNCGRRRMKAVAIVSGGLDSVTLAYQLAEEGYELRLLSFDHDGDIGRS